MTSPTPATATAAAAPVAESPPPRLVMQTVCDLTAAEIDEWFFLQAPILAAGAAGSPAAVWAVISPGSICLLGPADCTATPREMARYADQIADVVSETAGREIVNMGYEFSQVVRFAPTADEMRPDVAPRRRQRRRAGSAAAAGGGQAKVEPAGSSAPPAAAGLPASRPTLAERKEMVKAEADVNGPVRKAPKHE